MLTHPKSNYSTDSEWVRISALWGAVALRQCQSTWFIYNSSPEGSSFCIGTAIEFCYWAIIQVVHVSVHRKFPTECAGKMFRKSVNIWTKIWTKVWRLVFYALPWIITLAGALLKVTRYCIHNFDHKMYSTDLDLYRPAVCQPGLLHRLHCFILSLVLFLFFLYICCGV